MNRALDAVAAGFRSIDGGDLADDGGERSAGLDRIADGEVGGLVDHGEIRRNLEELGILIAGVDSGELVYGFAEAGVDQLLAHLKVELGGGPGFDDGGGDGAANSLRAEALDHPCAEIFAFR